MPRFKYQHGDRPLDGYTIERAVGRGGFGEVYYAVSGYGRQVALKALLQHPDTELRGLGQCMNLKSPHLVSIFDVKANEDGDLFVIMEYVAGPSLGDLLHEAPAGKGLGPAKAAYFVREIAKGLSYLHDRGIVHRDLKPQNIFFEEGYVKIGDYSLSKAISTTQHTAHTITVGTVHYMAPEIGKGNYGKSVDIYALGVILYEMLKGRPPFTGDSPGEIMMKHMTEQPRLGGLPGSSVLKKALAKDPADRYQDVRELAEDLFGSKHIQDSVSLFRPESLTVISNRLANDEMPIGPPRSSASEAEFETDADRRSEAREPQDLNNPDPTPGQRLDEFLDRAKVVTAETSARVKESLEEAKRQARIIHEAAREGIAEGVDSVRKNLNAARQERRASRVRLRPFVPVRRTGRGLGLITGLAAIIGLLLVLGTGLFVAKDRKDRISNYEYPKERRMQEQTVDSAESVDFSRPEPFPRFSGDGLMTPQPVRTWNSGVSKRMILHLNNDAGIPVVRGDLVEFYNANIRDFNNNIPSSDQRPAIHVPLAAHAEFSRLYLKRTGLIFSASLTQDLGAATVTGRMIPEEGQAIDLAPGTTITYRRPSAQSTVSVWQLEGGSVEGVQSSRIIIWPEGEALIMDATDEAHIKVPGLNDQIRILADENSIQAEVARRVAGQVLPALKGTLLKIGSTTNLGPISIRLDEWDEAPRLH